MMSYIKNIVGSDEDLIGVTRVHWIYLLKAFLWLILPAALILISFSAFKSWGDYPNTDWRPLIDVYEYYLFWVCVAFGVVMFCLLFSLYVATEVGLTSRRIIIKKGLFFY